MNMSKGDAVTYVALVTAAVMQAAEPWRKEAAVPPEAHPILSSSIWSYAPLVLLTLVGIIWLVKQLRSRKPTEPSPEIASPGETAVVWKPIYKALQHVSEKIADIDSKKCFPTARLALRQAAYDNRVRIRGKKQMTERSPHSDRSEHASIFTDVDNQYWANTEINAMATAAECQSEYHTDPQTAHAWGKLGLDERNRYYDLQVSWGDILKEWP